LQLLKLSNIKNKNFQGDKTGENISTKNPYYGEYTFHYWIWKNEIENIKNEWIGFCQYRKFWSLKRDIIEYGNLSELKKNVVVNLPDIFQNFESILGDPIFINQFKLSKFIKKNFFKILKNPSFILDRKKRNIKFHFDLMHGEGNLEKAIDLLEVSDREDFRNFVNSEVSFNPHNMFICKSNKILNNYYNSVFPWLKKCEREFGFDLDGYGLKRIYGFLAERYMSFWFKKYTKFKTIPIVFKDITYLS
tara:strand:- start:603 stop:1346 length:744 start_codon:yes stop_codon:yes gene_type:complete